ncbi:DUF4209 domain-containing protein [Hymenobacter jeollabukensis]|uniref:DUF4209 domain-containing protein n=1 Tax=Hymenobacter jeollabukensis TaxID=2025313 RepID=A0A5R8WK10_9BACT|nr:DUF4209 domain-containing protein [Hymenobacter jeollabukensis]TLM89369.1 DUF4209 domain-containing protein [Hymenobacter jeollabukensis]
MGRRSRERLLEPGEEVTATALFARLEQQACQLNARNFAADFNTLRKTAEANGDLASAARLDLERAAQLVWLSAHGLTHFHSWEDPVAAAHYLEARKAETTNGMLRLRYALVWLITLPKGRHTGKLAVEAVADILAWLRQDKGEHEATQETYFELVELGLLLSRQYRCRAEEVRQTVLDYLLNGRQPVVLRWWQLQFFGKHPDLFTPAECERLDIVARQIYEHYHAEDRYMVQMVCDAAIPLAARAIRDARRWHGLKGDSIKAHAQRRYTEDPTDFVVQTLLNDALNCYHAAGDKQQVQAVEKLISATKHAARLQTVELDFTLDGPEGKFISAWLRKMPAWILEDSGLVFWRLRYNLVPHRPGTATVAEKPELADLFRHVAFDRNRNITTRHQDQGRNLPFRPYELMLGLYGHMRFETFAQGLQNGQITYATTLGFLREQTWLGQMEFQRGQDAADAPGYTLISWVEPALRSYFAEMERAQQDKEYQPDLMLCIDSLTLKMEAILRHFCRALDPPIATNRRSKSGDQQELTLEEVIQAVESYSGSDAGYWLRYVFTKEGWNVRNNVAHGFMSPKDYSVTMMQAVILALFVLATLHIAPPDSHPLEN